MRTEESDLSPLQIFNNWWNANIEAIRVGDIDDKMLEDLCRSCPRIYWLACDNDHFEQSHIVVVPFPCGHDTDGRGKCQITLFAQNQLPTTFYLRGDQARALAHSLGQYYPANKWCALCGAASDDLYRMEGGWVCGQCFKEYSDE